MVARILVVWTFHRSSLVPPCTWKIIVSKQMAIKREKYRNHAWDSWNDQSNQPSNHRCSPRRHTTIVPEMVLRFFLLSLKQTSTCCGEVMATQCNRPTAILWTASLPLVPDFQSMVGFRLSLTSNVSTFVCICGVLQPIFYRSIDWTLWFFPVVWRFFSTIFWQPYSVIRCYVVDFLYISGVDGKTTFWILLSTVSSQYLLLKNLVSLAYWEDLRSFTESSVKRTEKLIKNHFS